MHPAQYQPGQVLPGTVYRVVRHLATGGMGSVYDVEDTTVEKRYVLKTLHPNLIAREDLALRMRDEAKSLAKLQHPNIVDVVTAGVTTDAQRMPFYVMERLIGQNLRVVLEKTSVLHLPHAYRIAIDLADALEHAHENNIVHRDVKPENIFLHRNSNGTTTTKLLDFGIVRLLDRKASHTHGKFIGTLRYASPEQITGKKVGPPTDIYSLGAVLFEMLAGRGPFDDAGDAYAIGAAHANMPAPPLSRFVRVTPEVEQLVATALAKDPEQRPRDCFAFASELRRILRDEEASPRSATAVNLLTSAAPPTQGQAADTGPTLHGMIPPSGASSQPNPSGGGPPTTRSEGVPAQGAPVTRNDGPVSPIAPTLAAAGVQPFLQNAPPPQQPAYPPAGALPMGGPRQVDRNAPTRESAPLGATQRLAQNDTRLEPLDAVPMANDDAVRAAFGEPAPLVVPGMSTGSNPGDIVFPPMQSSSATGPLSGEARTRPPERGPFILLGVAAVLAIAMVGGAFIAVKSRQSAAAPHAPVAVAPPSPSPTQIATPTPTPTLSPSSSPSPATPSSVAAVPPVTALTPAAPPKPPAPAPHPARPPADPKPHATPPAPPPGPPVIKFDP